MALLYVSTIGVLTLLTACQGEF